jgi:hypothetical protein
MRGYMVATDTQYLGILLLELGVVAPERGGLVRSTTGEVEDVEGKDYGVRAAIAT